MRFRDARVGDGPEVFAHDAVVILFTARVLPSDDGALDRRRAGDTFDPFVVGGAGASASKGFKLEIGSATNDIPEGWARAFEGDGDAMPRMRIGGKRIGADTAELGVRRARASLSGRRARGVRGEPGGERGD